MKSIIFPLLIIFCGVSALTGCSWVGKTAGKAQAKIERKANDLESGYHQGYGSEKSKGAVQNEKSSQTQTN